MYIGPGSSTWSQISAPAIPSVQQGIDADGTLDGVIHSLKKHSACRHWSLHAPVARNVCSVAPPRHGYRRVCWPRPLRVRPVCVRSRRALRPHVQSLRWLRVGAGGSCAAGGGAAVAGLTRHARRPRRIGLACRDTGCAAALPRRHSAPAARERRPGTQSTQRPLLAIPP
jgi:hypothetical protein